MKKTILFSLLLFMFQACATNTSKPLSADTPRYNLGLKSISWLEFHAIQIGDVEVGKIAVIEMAPHDPNTPELFEGWIGSENGPQGKSQAKFIGVRDGRRWYRLEIPVAKVTDGRFYFRIQGQGNNYTGSFKYQGRS